MPSLTSVRIDDEDDLQLCTPFTSYKNNSYLSSIEALTKPLPFPLTAINQPNMEDFCYITDSSYTKQDLESDTLNVFKFEMVNPTTKTFLRSIPTTTSEPLNLYLAMNYLREWPWIQQLLVVTEKDLSWILVVPTLLRRYSGGGEIMSFPLSCPLTPSLCSHRLYSLQSLNSMMLLYFLHRRASMF